MNTESTCVTFTRILAPLTFRNYLAELTCDDAETTNVVHKYATFLQLHHVFESLVNTKYNKCAWLSVTRGLQYIVQALDDYKDDDTYDWTELVIPPHLCYVHYSDLDKIDKPFWKNQPLEDVVDTDVGSALYEETSEFYMEHCQKWGVHTSFFMHLCHNYIEVILDYNSESGLTAIGNSILKLLEVDDVDYPDIMPDVETTTLNLDFNNEFSLDDTEVNQEEFFDNDEGGSLIDSVRSLCDNSMNVAVIRAALSLGLDTDEVYSGRLANVDISQMNSEYKALASDFIVSRLDLDESIVGNHEEFVESLTDKIIDLEEELAEEANAKLVDLESRCHEAFIVTLIESMRARDFEPLHAYGFSTQRMSEITDGNKLPIYPEFYTNVATILSTLLSVPTSQIRMILEPDYFSFSYMARDCTMIEM